MDFLRALIPFLKRNKNDVAKQLNITPEKAEAFLNEHSDVESYGKVPTKDLQSVYESYQRFSSGSLLVDEKGLSIKDAIAFINENKEALNPEKTLKIYDAAQEKLAREVLEELELTQTEIEEFFTKHPEAKSVTDINKMKELQSYKAYRKMLEQREAKKELQGLQPKLITEPLVKLETELQKLNKEVRKLQGQSVRKLIEINKEIVKAYSAEVLQTVKDGGKGDISKDKPRVKLLEKKKNVEKDFQCRREHIKKRKAALITQARKEAQSPWNAIWSVVLKNLNLGVLSEELTPELNRLTKGLNGEEELPTSEDINSFLERAKDAARGKAHSSPRVVQEQKASAAASASLADDEPLPEAEKKEIREFLGNILTHARQEISPLQEKCALKGKNLEKKLVTLEQKRQELLRNIKSSKLEDFMSEAADKFVERKEELGSKVREFDSEISFLESKLKEVSDNEHQGKMEPSQVERLQPQVKYKQGWKSLLRQRWKEASANSSRKKQEIHNSKKEIEKKLQTADSRKKKLEKEINKLKKEEKTLLASEKKQAKKNLIEINQKIDALTRQKQNVEGKTVLCEAALTSFQNSPSWKALLAQAGGALIESEAKEDSQTVALEEAQTIKDHMQERITKRNLERNIAQKEKQKKEQIEDDFFAKNQKFNGGVGQFFDMYNFSNLENSEIKRRLVNLMSKTEFGEEEITELSVLKQAFFDGEDFDLQMDRFFHSSIFFRGSSKENRIEFVEYMKDIYKKLSEIGA